METTAKRKRGPKPAGVEKGVFYARVDQATRERLEAYLESGCPLFSGMAEGGGFIKGSSLGVREPKTPDVSTFKAATEKVMSERAELMWKLRVSELEDKIKALEQAAPAQVTTGVTALLDDIQKLTDQVSFLEKELEECKNMVYDEKMAYWKARALKAEEYAASKNE